MYPFDLMVLQNLNESQLLVLILFQNAVILVGLVAIVCHFITRKATYPEQNWLTLQCVEISSSEDESHSGDSDDGEEENGIYFHYIIIGQL